MTQLNENQNYLIPEPITKLTLEQDLKLRQLEIRLNSGDVNIKDVITVFLALQKQNFVLANSLTNLVKQWPTPTDLNITDEELPMFGILLETRD